MSSDSEDFEFGYLITPIRRIFTIPRDYLLELESSSESPSNISIITPPVSNIRVATTVAIAIRIDDLETRFEALEVRLESIFTYTDL